MALSSLEPEPLHSAPIVTRSRKYELVTRLASGGMAEIWLARVHGIEGFAKQVVLKRILPEHATDEYYIRMFVNEARLAAGLDHPNIAPVYDIGAEGDNYFFTMEYVEGRDLRQILGACTAAERRIPLPQALAPVIGTAAGLHYAHEKRAIDGAPLGIVHRDVSPSNVIVRFDGGIKLIDFGIAKATFLPSETQTSVMKGKVSYMSPEQCLGEPLDRRSDVFSLGIVLYELTTGRRPFVSRSPQALLHLISTKDAPPPSKLVDDYCPELEQIVLRALARDPSRRYATAEEMQLALEDFARQRRLNTSMVATARFMEELFGQPIAKSDEVAAVLADDPVSSTGSADAPPARDVAQPVESSVNVVRFTQEWPRPASAEAVAHAASPSSPDQASLRGDAWLARSSPGFMRRGRAAALLLGAAAIAAVAVLVGASGRSERPAAAAVAALDVNAAPRPSSLLADPPHLGAVPASPQLAAPVGRATSALGARASHPAVTVKRVSHGTTHRAQAPKRPHAAIWDPDSALAPE